MNYTDKIKPYKPILPKFQCKCYKEYDKLASLTNHIYNEHSNQQEKYRVKRGVPEGRNKKLDSQQIKFLQDNFSTYFENDQNLSDDQIRLQFKQIVDLISNIVNQHDIKKYEKELQRENIRLQPIWRFIKKEYILEVMEKYFISFLFSYYNATVDNSESLLNDKEVQNLKVYFKENHQYGKINQSLINKIQSKHYNDIQIKIKEESDEIVQFHQSFVDKYMQGYSQKLSVH